MTTTEALSEEGDPENSAMTTEVSEDSEDYIICPRDRRQRQRRRRLNSGLEGCPTMRAASSEEDSNKDGGVCVGQVVDAASEG